jgi:arginase
MQQSVVIQSPVILGLSHQSDQRARRLEELPRALAKAAMLGSRGPRDLVVLSHLSDCDDDLRLHEASNARALRDFAVASADAIRCARELGYKPVVYGGERSVLPGCGLALARTGRYALVYLDAHHNYCGPGQSDASEAARADLAIVTGAGSDHLANIEGRSPYFREEDVLSFGFRHPDASNRWMFEEVRRTRIGLATLEDGRALGMDWVGRALADSYEKQPALDGFWVHLDADVLDPVPQGALNHAEPGGLKPGELATLLARLLRSPRFVGMDVTIADFELDPDGEALRTFVDVLAKAFQGRLAAKL